MIPSRNAHRFNQNREWLSKTGQKLQKTRDIWRNSRGNFTSLNDAWTGFGKINHIPTVQIILLPALSAFARHENQPWYVLYQSVPIQRIVSETFIWSHYCKFSFSAIGVEDEASQLGTSQYLWEYGTGKWAVTGGKIYRGLVGFTIRNCEWPRVRLVKNFPSPRWNLHPK